MLVHFLVHLVIFNSGISKMTIALLPGKFQPLHIGHVMLAAYCLKNYDKVIELNPNHEIALYSIAMLYGKIEEPDLGILYMKKALTINPKNEDYQKGLDLLSFIKAKINES